MKLIYKILWINIAIAFLISFIAPVDDTYLFNFGIVSLLAAIFDIVISIILFIVAPKVWGQGFLLSAGVLLSVSAISCSFSL